ncbi:MAG: Ig-like domain-containing protein [Chitinophagaceae bacterium]
MATRVNLYNTKRFKFAPNMNYRRLISSVVFLLIIAISITSGPGCANIIPPQGGPRDSIPPILIKVTPGDSAKNFNSNKINFSFNEFIDVQNVQENLMVSPTPKNNPTIDFKLNTLTVKLKDSLEPNTTYSINFRESIKDFSEGNIMKGFTYIFSTGPFIDSLKLQGKVVLAESGKVDSTLIVMLHTSADDSIIVKEKPRYISRLDANGNFIFRNLPPKTFYLYALKDDGGSNRYFSDKQLFAFAEKPVTANLNPDTVTLYAYATSTPVAQQTSNNTSGLRIKTGGANADKRLKFQTNLLNNQLDLLSNFTITFDNALRSFDTAQIHMYKDTTFIPVDSFRFEKDSSNKKIQLIHAWKENTVYHLVMDKDFAEDSSGKKLLKTDTVSFKTKKLAEYGSLKLKFRNLDITKNPVLQFLSSDKIVQSYVFGNSSEFLQTLFLPGEYELRILFDDNKNGKWDSGEFFGKHKQPEIVKIIERKITVKPAWQNEFEIQTPL